MKVLLRLTVRLPGLLFKCLVAVDQALERLFDFFTRCGKDDDGNPWTGIL